MSPFDSAAPAVDQYELPRCESNSTQFESAPVSQTNCPATSNTCTQTCCDSQVSLDSYVPPQQMANPADIAPATQTNCPATSNTCTQTCCDSQIQNDSYVPPVQGSDLNVNAPTTKTSCPATSNTCTQTCCDGISFSSDTFVAPAQK